MTFSAAAANWPSCISVMLSNAYDENVVKPPRMPTSRKARASGVSTKRCSAAPTMAPKVMQPTTLTANVPMGKSDPDRRRIAVDRTKRDAEPIAPPIATNARLTRFTEENTLSRHYPDIIPTLSHRGGQADEGDRAAERRRAEAQKQQRDV